MKTPIHNTDRCITCTACSAACPVAGATPEFDGPRMTGPLQELLRLAGGGEDGSLHYCSNCKACDVACPFGVPVSAFIMRARAASLRGKRSEPGEWLLAHVGRPGLSARLLPAFVKNRLLGNGTFRALLHRLGLAGKAPLPSFASRPFRARFQRLAQPGGLPRQVALFPGCFVNGFEPETGLDLVAVLNRAGYEVLLPQGFVCCGMPLLMGGFWDEAVLNAEKNLKELRLWKERGISVVTGCPSCALAFKEEYLRHFPALADEDNRLVPVDACEFLLHALERGELHAPGAEAQDTPVRIFYHAPCHARAQGMGLPGLALLREIPGARVEYAGALCCGLAGTYGFTSDKYAIGQRVGKSLSDRLRQSNAETGASECAVCRIQMRQAGTMPAQHPVSLLRRYLDGGG